MLDASTPDNIFRVLLQQHAVPSSCTMIWRTSVAFVWPNDLGIESRQMVVDRALLLRFQSLHRTPHHQRLSLLGARDRIIPERPYTSAAAARGQYTSARHFQRTPSILQHRRISSCIRQHRVTGRTQHGTHDAKTRIGLWPVGPSDA